MKTNSKFLAFALLVSAFVMLGSTRGIAQDPCADTDAIAAADLKIRENYEKKETRKIALDVGKNYMQKYGTCEASKTFVAWLAPQIPVWEKQVKESEEYEWAKVRFDKFENGLKTGKFEDSYASGGELLSKYPDNMNILLPLGLIGLYESYKNNHKYNDDTVRYAQMAIAKFRAGGIESKKDKEKKAILDKAGKEVYGWLQFERNKDEALSELTYALAHINYHAKKDRKAALPYYYAVAQMPGRYKAEPRLYIALGSFYDEEAAPIGREIIALIEKQKAAPTDAEKEKLDVDIKAKEALYKGYSERALDAFGRAYQAADETVAAEKALKAEVYKKLQSLYEQRFEKKDGLEAYIRSSTAKSMPNPTTAVTPISDPEPVTTATPGANTTAVKTAADAKAAAAITPAAVKPAAPKGKTLAKPVAAKGKAAKPTKRAVRKP